MKEPIVIAPYDPGWPGHFERVRAELLESVGAFVTAIEHIGSTSVPGLAAKPIVDVMIGVPDPVLLDVSAEPEVVVGAPDDIEPAGPEAHVALVRGIKRLGYVYRSVNGIPDRLFFKRTDVEPGRHLHLVQIDSPFWERHLLFRDHLRAHPEEAEAYATLKRTLAAAHREDRIAYTDAKTAFIQRCERLARDTHGA